MTHYLQNISITTHNSTLCLYIIILMCQTNMVDMVNILADLLNINTLALLLSFNVIIIFHFSHFLPHVLLPENNVTVVIILTKTTFKELTVPLLLRKKTKLFFKNIDNHSHLLCFRYLTESSVCVSWDTLAWWTPSASGGWDTRFATHLPNSWNVTGCSWRRPTATPKLLVFLPMVIHHDFDCWFLEISVTLVKSKLFLLHITQANDVHVSMMLQRRFTSLLSSPWRTLGCH